MVCDDYYKVQLMNTCFMIGTCVGTILFGVIGDKYGRRMALLVSCFLQIFVLNSLPLVDNFNLFCVGRFLSGALHIGSYMAAFTIIMELFGGTAATIFGVAAHIVFAASYLLVTTLAYFIRDWQILSWSVSSISLLFIPLYWLAPESIRWLVINERVDEAEEIVKRIAKFNGKKVPKEVLRNSLEIPRKVESASLLDLFRSREYLCVTIPIFFLWMIDSAVYYGISLNTSLLPGDIFISFTMSAVGEVLGYLISVPAMEFVGRRMSFVISLGLSGICLLFFCFIRNTAAIAVLTTLGKLGISAAYAITYNYTAELYPTAVRSKIMGCGSAMAGLGSIIAPQITLIAEYLEFWAPFVIFGSFSLLAAVFSSFLPETKGQAMMESFEQGTHFIGSQHLATLRLCSSRKVAEKSDALV